MTESGTRTPQKLCRFCQQSIPAAAKVCSHCRRRQGMQPWQMVLLGLIAIVMTFFAGCAACVAFIGYNMSSLEEARQAANAKEAADVVAKQNAAIEPEFMFMDGRDPEARPPLTITTINVWNGPERSRVVCKLEHGDRVQVIEKRADAANIVGGTCKGWVTLGFLSTQKEPVIGDLVR